MYQKPFQRIAVSALGIGSLRLPTVEGNPNCIDRAKAQRVIDAALENGINYIDTAYTYHVGDSERFLGEALSRHPRERYLLASKFYVAASTDIRAVFEAQLRRCRTEYFDFYLLHGMAENYFAAYTDPEKDYLGYLLEQKKAGRIRYIGFSSHAAPETLSRFLDFYDRFDMALIQMNYLDWTMLDAKRQYALLTERGIPVWVMEPLKGGLLSTLSPEAAAILKQAAPERSLSSWALRFCMGFSNVQTVLSGMSTVEQVLENCAIFNRPDPLSSREAQALRQAASVYLKSMGVPCSACRYCCPACPAQLDIPVLLKGFNEYRVSGEIWRVKDVPCGEHGPRACLQCGACLQYCPQKIDIPAALRQFAALLK